MSSVMELNTLELFRYSNTKILSDIDKRIPKTYNIDLDSMYKHTKCYLFKEYFDYLKHTLLSRYISKLFYKHNINK